MANVFLTKESYDKLKADLQHMKSVGRAEAGAALAEAREKGDLSENAEYDAAKEEQAKLEKRIAQLETALASVRILDENEIDDSKVSILTTIKVKNLKANKEFTYKMVSEIEADFKTGKLSVISPIGKGLLGHKKGEKVIIQTPAGAMEYQILDIKK
ncbi:MAG: transcription elongation factor GreA [Chitinophagales bacterium]|jgi:transcription elongation factor GreA|nr:transcription elongation factor GreA [Sphingobacteriales bacterium]